MPEDRRDFVIDHELSQDETAGAGAEQDNRTTVSATPVEIPIEALSPAALSGIIDAFILREGTDYGAVEASHAAKVAQVRTQLERRDVVITFDPATESVTIIARAEWARLEQAGITR